MPSGQHSDIRQIIDLFKTITLVKQRRTRRNVAFDTAIYTLHQKYALAPSLIRNILDLFEVNIGERYIINVSDRMMRQRILPSWIKRCEGLLVKFSGVQNGQ